VCAHAGLETQGQCLALGPKSLVQTLKWNPLSRFSSSYKAGIVIITWIERLTVNQGRTRFDSWDRHLSLGQTLNDTIFAPVIQ